MTRAEKLAKLAELRAEIEGIQSDVESLGHPAPHKYKVGDDVTITAYIEAIDSADEDLPYKVALKQTWYSESALEADK